MNMRSIQDLYLCVVSFSETFVLQRLPAPPNLVRKQILVIAFSLLLFSAVQKELATYLYESLLSVPNVRIYGPAPSQTDHRAPLCSFNVENLHPTDIAQILNLPVC
jgi:hypothetical protein